MDSRSDVLYCFFYLLSLICYLSAMQAEGRWKRYGGVGAGAVLYLFSMMSKEMGATLPMVLVLLHWYWWRQGKMSLRGMAWTAPFWIAFGLLMALRQTIVAVPLDVYAEYPRLVMYLNVLKGIAIHLLRVLIPVGADYRELWPKLINHIDPSLSEPFIYLSAALTGSLVVLAFVFRRSYPLLSLLIGFFLVAITPLFVVNRILGVSNDLSVIPVEERWIYLPAVPVFILGGLAVERLAGWNASRGRSRLVVAGVAVALMAGMGWQASIHAANFDNPLAEVKRYYLFPESELAPYERMRRDSLFAVYVDLPMGKFSEAETRAKNALAAMPGSPIPYVALAKVYAAQGKWREVGPLLGPWVSPTPDFLMERWKNNKKVATDVLSTYHVIPYLFGMAVAYEGSGKDAAELLCMSLNRGYAETEIAEALHAVWALNGPAQCVHAANIGECIKKAPAADSPEWRRPLNRDACQQWRDRFAH
ncbi:MAG: hypothetical protein HZA04_00200 [Nitrospinae bacterium]|nr:hypothetical protein [Nitrospinota bacterium]